MSYQVKIPAVGESITSGLLSAWLRKDGEAVRAGDALFTLETDKVSTDVTADRAGVLKIQVAEGTEVRIGEVVGTIEEGAVAAAAPAAPAAPAVPAPAPAAAPAVVPAPPPVAAAPPPAASAPDNLEEPPPAPLAPAPHGDGRVTRKRISPIRRKIAAQLVMAQHTAAILTTFNEADMSGVMDLRKRIQDDFVARHGVKLGFMSFFIKAAVKALQEVPQINARIDGDDLIENHYYDISVAVGTERGLVVPVVRDADKKSFADIERDLGFYAQRAREGKLKVEELLGGVFSISNGGVYGSLLSTPILNPPQAAILGMHKIQERPVAVNGQVQIRPMMYLALSYDHRIVDGKEAVTFLIKIKEAIEDPARLLVGA